MKIKSLYRLLSPNVQKILLEYKINLQTRYAEGNQTFHLVYNLINKNREEYAVHLSKFLKYQEIFTQIKDTKLEKNPLLPSYNNGFLPGLDVITIYGLIAELKPKRYMEIGSGNSTKIAYKSIRENNLNTFITSIDPQPRVFIDELAGKVIRKSIAEVDLSVVEQLAENDILFYDGSHFSAPNSDVTIFFLEILPRLKKGVVVHIHDIYLPYDYPQFMIERYYNEQYLLACWLLANPDKFKIIFPNFFVSEDAELSKMLNPVWNHPNLKNVEKHGGSFWFQMN